MSLCHLTHDSQQSLSAQQGKAVRRLHAAPQDQLLTRQNTPKHLTQPRTILNEKIIKKRKVGRGSKFLTKEGPW